MNLILLLCTFTGMIVSKDIPQNDTTENINAIYNTNNKTTLDIYVKYCGIGMIFFMLGLLLRKNDSKTTTSASKPSDFMSILGSNTLADQTSALLANITAAPVAVSTNTIANTANTPVEQVAPAAIELPASTDRNNYPHTRQIIQRNKVAAAQVQASALPANVVTPGILPANGTINLTHAAPVQQVTSSGIADTHLHADITAILVDRHHAKYDRNATEGATAYDTNADERQSADTHVAALIQGFALSDNPKSLQYKSQSFICNHRAVGTGEELSLDGTVYGTSNVPAAAARTTSQTDATTPNTPAAAQTEATSNPIASARNAFRELFSSPERTNSSATVASEASPKVSVNSAVRSMLNNPSIRQMAQAIVAEPESVANVAAVASPERADNSAVLNAVRALAPNSDKVTNNIDNDRGFSGFRKFLNETFN